MIHRPWADPVLPLFIFCLLPVGCARYESRPLTETAVNQALAVPDPAELVIQARELNHPIQKPLELDIADGISPDEAAVLAILPNPSLRGERDRRALADAQLLQAGIFPTLRLMRCSSLSSSSFFSRAFVWRSR